MNSKKKDSRRKNLKLMINLDNKSVYKKGHIVASGSIDELIRYKKQLITHGITMNSEIRDASADSWSVIISAGGKNLVEHNGLLYPERNVAMSENIKGKQIASLRDIHKGLSELKELSPKGDAIYFEHIQKIIDERIQTVKCESLNINMV